MVKNVLILDDDALDLEGMKLLVDWNKLDIEKVFCASSVAQAKTLIQTETIHIVLCDIELPRESGLDFTQWMAEHKMKSVVIFVTSHAKFDYASRALKLRARDYLLKPVPAAALEESIRNAAAYLDALDGHSRQAAPPPSDDCAVVTQVKAYVHAHLSESITRADIARTVYLHPDYLSHIFRDNTGITLSDYILQQRVELARKLLEEGWLSVSEIGEKAGFSNTSHFDKIFRKYMACTPKEYRKLCRKERGMI